jgi:hypothetical protein
MVLKSLQFTLKTNLETLLLLGLATLTWKSKGITQKEEKALEQDIIARTPDPNGKLAIGHAKSGKKGRFNEEYFICSCFCYQSIFSF